MIRRGSSHPRLAKFAVVSCAAAFVLSAGGCTSLYEPRVAAPAGQPFELRVGQIAELEQGIEVAFTDVIEDSRCPQDVQCIWAGEAVVRIGTRVRGQRWREQLLRTSAPDAAARIDARSVRLLSLDPSPKKDQPVLREEYRAKLIVE